MKIKLGECHPGSRLSRAERLLLLPVDKRLPDLTVTFDLAVMASPHITEVCPVILLKLKSILW